LMKFYSDHNFNPLSSCLPLLLQLPFFLSLYYLQTQDEFKNEVRETGKEFLFIPDLTENATDWVLVALIVIYVATQLGSSLVTMINVQDRNQRRIMLALPFFFTIIIVNFPTGLLVYWITTNVWTIGQQLAVKKFLPPPEPVSVDAKRPGDGKPDKRRKGMLARAAERAQEQGTEGGKGARESDGKGPKPKEKPKPKAASGDGRGSTGGGNGGPRKAPPPSPRKKKKRSGRRR
jgi:YidC/Oxa1 family membrane protein insertase